MKFLKDDSVAPEKDDEFSGDAWGEENTSLSWMTVDRKRSVKEELDHLVDEFLAMGNKITECKTGEGTMKTAVYNNRIIDFTSFGKTPLDQTEANKRFVKRVYGGDAKIVEKMKEAFVKGLDREGAREYVSESNLISSLKFDRILKYYFEGTDLIESYKRRTLADIQEKSNKLKDEIAKILKKCNHNGMTKQDSLKVVMSKTGCTYCVADKTCHKQKLKWPKTDASKLTSKKMFDYKD